MPVYSLDAFISQIECNNIIKLCNGKLRTALSIGDLKGKDALDFRKADAIWINRNNTLIQPILKKVASVFNWPIEYQEFPHVVKYSVGGEYKCHYDFFQVGKSYSVKELSNGGQRLFTFLVYLNDNFKGGETEFPNQNIIIKPKTGTAIIWSNTAPNGIDLDKESLHSGLPVIEGEKYIMVIWFREMPFKFQNDDYSNSYLIS